MPRFECPKAKPPPGHPCCGSSAAFLGHQEESGFSCSSLHWTLEGGERERQRGDFFNRKAEDGFACEFLLGFSAVWGGRRGVEWKGWWRGWGWDAEMLLTGRRPQQIKTDSEGAQPCEALLELALGLRGRRRRSVTGGGRLPPLVPPSSATTWQSFFFSGSRQRKQEV